MHTQRDMVKLLIALHTAALGLGLRILSLIALQGAAFDLPQASAQALLGMSEELTKRKFTLDKPSSLPMEQERRWVA